jgi:hypothetical protein
VLVLGCGQSSQVQRQPEPKPRAEAASDASAPTDTEGSEVRANDGYGESDNGARVATVNRDGVVRENPPAPRQPIDARVIAVDEQAQKIVFRIGLPSSAPRGQITTEWTGLFIVDGKPAKGTNFKLVHVRDREILCELQGTKLPSEAVRLYEPNK